MKSSTHCKTENSVFFFKLKEDLISRLVLYYYSSLSHICSILCCHYLSTFSSPPVSCFTSSTVYRHIHLRCFFFTLLSYHVFGYIQKPFLYIIFVSFLTVLCTTTVFTSPLLKQACNIQNSIILHFNR